MPVKSINLILHSFLFMLILIFFTFFFFLSERVPSVATFKGAQYLSYDITNRGDSITSSIEEISLLFRTRQASGLIFYTGNLCFYHILTTDLSVCLIVYKKGLEAR